MKTEKFKKGEKVIITYNPFHGKEGENKLAEVVGILKGQGMNGSDMVELQCCNPKTGLTEVLPFGIYNVKKMTPTKLRVMAMEYRSEANRLQKMADELDGENNDII